MTDRITVDGELFLGRVDEQNRFRDLLRTVLEHWSGPPMPLPRRDEPDWSYVVLMYGEGGMGKTMLAKRLRDIATDEPPFKGKFQTL